MEVDNIYFLLLSVYRTAIKAGILYMNFFSGIDYEAIYASAHTILLSDESNSSLDFQDTENSNFTTESGNPLRVNDEHDFLESQKEIDNKRNSTSLISKPTLEVAVSFPVASSFNRSVMNLKHQLYGLIQSAVVETISEVLNNQSHSKGSNESNYHADLRHQVTNIAQGAPTIPIESVFTKEPFVITAASNTHEGFATSEHESSETLTGNRSNDHIDAALLTNRHSLDDIPISRNIFNGVPMFTTPQNEISNHSTLDVDYQRNESSQYYHLIQTKEKSHNILNNASNISSQGHPSPVSDQIPIIDDEQLHRNNEAPYLAEFDSNSNINFVSHDDNYPQDMERFSYQLTNLNDPFLNFNVARKYSSITYTAQGGRDSRNLDTSPPLDDLNPKMFCFNISVSDPQQKHENVTLTLELHEFMEEQVQVHLTDKTNSSRTNYHYATDMWVKDRSVNTGENPSEGGPRIVSESGELLENKNIMEDVPGPLPQEKKTKRESITIVLPSHSHKGSSVHSILCV